MPVHKPSITDTDKVELVLSTEQYKILLKLLHFADYVADSGLISEFKTINDRNELFDVLRTIYECGDQANLPTSLSLTTITSRVRFSDEEEIRLMRQVESDLEHIARQIFASYFAKRDLKKVLDAVGDDNIDSKILKSDLISKRAKIYRKEFESNGIKNLRFKMFHKLSCDGSDS